MMKLVLTEFWSETGVGNGIGGGMDSTPIYWVSGI